MEESEQRLDRRRLDTVVDPRARRRLEMDAQVRPRYVANCDQHREPGFDRPGFNPGQMAVVDPGSPGQGPYRQSGVDPQSTDLEPDPASQLPGRPSDRGPAACPRHVQS